MDGGWGGRKVGDGGWGPSGLFCGKHTTGTQMVRSRRKCTNIKRHARNEGRLTQPHWSTCDACWRTHHRQQLDLAASPAVVSRRSDSEPPAFRSPQRCLLHQATPWSAPQLPLPAPSAAELLFVHWRSGHAREVSSFAEETFETPRCCRVCAFFAHRGIGELLHLVRAI